MLVAYTVPETRVRQEQVNDSRERLQGQGPIPTLSGCPTGLLALAAAEARDHLNQRLDHISSSAMLIGCPQPQPRSGTISPSFIALRRAGTIFFILPAPQKAVTPSAALPWL